MRKNIKIISFILLILTFFSFIFNNTSFSAFDFKQAIRDTDDAEDTSKASTSAKNIVGTIIQIIRIIAVGVAVIILLVLSIRYMTESPEGKSSVKQSAVIYVIGAVILFATSGILTLISNLASNFKTS